MRRRDVLYLCAFGVAAACATDPAGPSLPAPTVISISPATGAADVSVTAPVVIVFSHAMMQGMEANVALHEGLVTGPAVAGTATWSTDRATLTFTPSAPLRHATTYVLHLAPTLTSGTGQRLDHAACEALGGQGVTSGMMGGGMMGGGMMGGGMMGGATMGPGMMGSGWRMSDGGYGTSFTFTTA